MVSSAVVGFPPGLKAGILFTAVAFVYFRVPETIGRSLEEIESDLEENTVVGADEKGMEANSQD